MKKETLKSDYLVPTRGQAACEEQGDDLTNDCRYSPPTGAQQRGREQGHNLERDESCLVPAGDQAAVQFSTI